MALEPTADETDVARIGRLAPLARGLSTDIRVEGPTTLSGREQVMAAAIQAGRVAQRLAIVVRDIEISVASSRRTATALAIPLPSPAGISGAWDDITEFQLDLTRQNDVWLVSRVAPVAALRPSRRAAEIQPQRHRASSHRATENRAGVGTPRSHAPVSDPKQPLCSLRLCGTFSVALSSSVATVTRSSCLTAAARPQQLTRRDLSQVVGVVLRHVHQRVAHGVVRERRKLEGWHHRPGETRFVLANTRSPCPTRLQTATPATASRRPTRSATAAAAAAMGTAVPSQRSRNQSCQNSMCARIAATLWSPLGGGRTASSGDGVQRAQRRHVDESVEQQFANGHACDSTRGPRYSGRHVPPAGIRPGTARHRRGAPHRPRPTVRPVPRSGSRQSAHSRRPTSRHDLRAGASCSSAARASACGRRWRQIFPGCRSSTAASAARSCPR